MTMEELLSVLDGPTQIAVDRCAHLSEGEQTSFLRAFHDARALATRGGDLELLWRKASRFDCSLAGHIEGVAAARAEELP